MVSYYLKKITYLFRCKCIFHFLTTTLLSLDKRRLIFYSIENLKLPLWKAILPPPPPVGCRPHVGNHWCRGTKKVFKHLFKIKLKHLICNLNVIFCTEKIKQNIKCKKTVLIADFSCAWACSANISKQSFYQHISIQKVL